MERVRSLPAEAALLAEAFGERPGDERPDRGCTVEEGRRRIEECIGAWGLPPRWLHGLDFLGSTGALLHYRARFSAPAPASPVPGAASVYFALAEPGGELRFVAEGGRLVRAPGTVAGLGERWLEEVVELKAALRGAALGRNE